MEAEEEEDVVVKWRSCCCCRNQAHRMGKPGSWPAEVVLKPHQSGSSGLLLRMCSCMCVCARELVGVSGDLLIPLFGNQNRFFPGAYAWSFLFWRQFSQTCYMWDSLAYGLNGMKLRDGEKGIPKAATRLVWINFSCAYASPVISSRNSKQLEIPHHFQAKQRCHGFQSMCRCVTSNNYAMKAL